MIEQVFDRETESAGTRSNTVAGGNIMSSTRQSLDSNYELSSLERRPLTLREQLAFVSLPVAVSLFAGAFFLTSELVLALLMLAVGFALTGIWVSQERYPEKANSVVLLGKSPMAAVIASTIETRAAFKNPTIVHRATNQAEATMLLRSIPCDEIILAGPVGPLTADFVDRRGFRPAVIEGPEKLELLLGRVPLELASKDKWLNRLGTIRSLNRGYASFKRSFDLLFSLLLGLVLLPVFPVIALAIKLDSPGSVFYSQTRVGLGGRTFRIYKFRTMRSDAERHGAVWAQVGDARITRVGKFMRLTRFDELPQIWNVIKGDMTVVGPRPERPEFTETLVLEIPGYELRHTVKPGLTGWAQVCYRYTSSIRDTKAKVEYDLYYVKHLSLRMDLQILLRTVKVVFGLQGR